ncbi:MAG: SlyX family protein [Rhodospirillales bacterium]|nr:SlyX family protein [Rhodospirillales bacterium]
MNEEDRLTTIETQIAHQDQQIQELNAVITEQWKVIDALKAKLLRAEDKLEELRYRSETGDGEGLSPTEIAARDKPPHY